MERFCDLCKLEGAGEVPAIVDAKTTLGPWGYLCPMHDASHSASQNPMLRIELAKLPKL